MKSMYEHTSIFQQRNDGSLAKNHIATVTLGMLTVIGAFTLDRPEIFHLSDTLLEGYTTDIFGSSAACALLSTGIQKYPQVKSTTIIGIQFIANSVFEVGQYLHLLPGQYDPKDFLAYALGGAFWLGIDRGAKVIGTYRQKRRN